MNLTYVILAHEDPNQLLRLVNSLLEDNVSFVVHIDKRAKLVDFQVLFDSPEFAKIYFIKNRCSSPWGSFSIIQATLNCFKFVLKIMPSTDRIVLLSGKDYPIKSNRYIKSYLEENPFAIYLNHFQIPYSKWIDGGILRFPNYQNISKIIKLYAGSQWLSLPTFVLNIIFDFLKLNPNYIAYFKKVSIPAESFFQTLLLNCEEKIVDQNLVDRNLHFVKWDYPYLHPTDFDVKHFKQIKKSKSLFARKFTCQHQPEVLDKIDQELLLKDPNGQKTTIKKISQSSEKKNDLAILFLTNKHDDDTIKAYNEIRNNLRANDVFFLFHKKGKFIPPTISSLKPFIFDNSILKSIDFVPIETKLVPGSNHFPLFKFYKANPDYKYYWYIEDDVRFNGNWNVFFDFFSKEDIKSDFLTSHIRKYEDEPNWYWWETLTNSASLNVATALRLRSFNPIFRISNPALKYLNRLFSSGWVGHHEVTMPTLLHLGGFSINELGGDSQFSSPKLKNRFYLSDKHDNSGCLTTSSMRFRPLIQNEEMTKQFLYHPVKKDFSNYNNICP